MAAVVAHVVVPNDAILKKIENLRCENKWIAIPNDNSVFDYCVDEIAKFAVEAYNVIVSGHFKYKNLDAGWYVEFKDILQAIFHLHLTVTDCFGVDIKVEVVVSVTFNIFGGEKVMKLESFKPICA